MSLLRILEILLLRDWIMDYLSPDDCQVLISIINKPLILRNAKMLKSEIRKYTDFFKYIIPDRQWKLFIESKNFKLVFMSLQLFKNIYPMHSIVANQIRCMNIVSKNSGLLVLTDKSNFIPFTKDIAPDSIFGNATIYDNLTVRGIQTSTNRTVSCFKYLLTNNYSTNWEVFCLMLDTPFYTQLETKYNLIAEQTALYSRIHLHKYKTFCYVFNKNKID